MSLGTAISRSVLSDQVKDRLLQAILDGRFPPGSRIVETRAAREFGTSQAPVREALRDLEAVGVVEITPFHGARVRHPSTDELLEAFVVRSELETLAARLAVPRLGEADLRDLRADLAHMHAAVASHDLHAEAEADAHFHERLMRISGNATLQQVWRRLEPFSRTYITLTAATHGHRVADLHGPVLDALAERDAPAAVAALRRHFVAIEAMLKSSLDAVDVVEAAPPDPGPTGTGSGSDPRPASKRLARQARKPAAGVSRTAHLPQRRRPLAHERTP